MNYIVTDLECTCSNSKEFPREEMETIEIGAVLLNSKYEVIDKFSRFVKPEIHPTLTQFCTELTTIQQSDVDCASDFSYVFNEFVNFTNQVNEFVFVSWGAFDFKQLNRDCEKSKINNPLTCEVLNFKTEFANVLRNGNTKSLGFKKAMNIAKMKFEGTHHRGIDDAINIARLMKKIRTEES